MDPTDLSRCAEQDCAHLGYWKTSTGQRCPQHRKEQAMNDNPQPANTEQIGSITVKSMTTDEIVAAKAAGRFDDLLAGNDPEYRQTAKGRAAARQRQQAHLDGGDA